MRLVSRESWDERIGECPEDAELMLDLIEEISLKVVAGDRVTSGRFVTLLDSRRLSSAAI